MFSKLYCIGQQHFPVQFLLAKVIEKREEIDAGKKCGIRASRQLSSLWFSQGLRDPLTVQSKVKV